VRASRATKKRRELAILADSKAIGWGVLVTLTSNHVSPTHERLAGQSRRSTSSRAPLSAQERTSSNPFEVLSAMTIGNTEKSSVASQSSSASTHFKRKKSRKQIPSGHRPITWSLSGCCSYDSNAISNDNLCSPLSNEDGPSRVEQVLATNDEHSVEQRMVQLVATFQQKEDELVALHGQVGNHSHNNERHASTSDNEQRSEPTPTLEAIQRMISEGVRAQYMQTHYYMRPRYVKPYPPEVDIVPFPNNYHQPHFSKFNGTGSPHEHVVHFLAACQDTSHNGALFLRQFVQTLSKPAFTWHSKLAPDSIRTWEQMQDVFLERFYSTQRTIGIIELTQTLQRANERVFNLINRWRNLSLHCPRSITEPEAVRMCMNNLSPDMTIY
jgi:hypothetical protein